MTDYRQVAALALAKCAAYDPWFPKASQAIVDSWAEQIDRYRLELPDVLEGVTKMYADNGSGFRPLPKDLTDAARAVARERDAKAGPSPEYEALCESKAADAAELAEIRARRARSAITEDRPRLAELTAGFGKAVRDA